MKKVQLLFIVLVFVFYHSSNGQGILWLAKPKYERIQLFSEDVTCVQFNGKWGYLNTKGEEILHTEYEKVYDFREEVGIVTTANDEIKYIVDKFGNRNEVNPGFKLYLRFPAFSNGLLLVTDGNKWGYLNKYGKLAIDCKFSFALPFSEGKAAVSFSKYGIGNWAYINTEGNVIINAEGNFDWALSFYNDKAFVIKNDKLSFIDSNGNILKNSELSSFNFKLLEGIKSFNTFTGIVKSTGGDIIFRGNGVLEKINVKGDTLFLIPKENIVSPQTSIKTNTNSNGKNIFIVDGKELNAQFDKVVWYNNEIAIVEKGGRLGIVQIFHNDILSLTINSDTVFSVFGNINPVEFEISNNLSSIIKNIEILFPDRSRQIIGELKPNSQEDILWLLNPEVLSKKRIELEVSYGEIGSISFSFYLLVKDISALTVKFPKDIYELTTKSDSVFFDLFNNTKYDANSVGIKVFNNGQTLNYLNTLVNIKANSKSTLSFKIPVETEKQKEELRIIIQPPNNSPSILFNKEITLIKNEPKSLTPFNDMIPINSKNNN